jgi:hypothetical protein
MLAQLQAGPDYGVAKGAAKHSRRTRHHDPRAAAGTGLVQSVAQWFSYASTTDTRTTP